MCVSIVILLIPPNGPPPPPEPSLELIENFIERNRYDIALEKLNSLKKEGDSYLIYLEGEIHFNLANFYSNLFKISLDDEMEFLKRNYLHKNVLGKSYVRPFFVGYSFYQRGEFSQSLLYFKEFLKEKNKPDSLENLSKLFIGSIYYKTKKLNNAELIWNEVKRKMGKDKIVKTFYLRLLLESELEIETTEDLFRQDDYAYQGLLNENWINLAAIESNSGRNENALKMLENYNVQNPVWSENFVSDDTLINKLARNFYSPYHYKVRASVHYRIALEKFLKLKAEYTNSPEYKDSLYKTGWIYYIMEDYQKASTEWNFLLSEYSGDMMNDLPIIKEKIEERLKKCNYHCEGKEFDVSVLDKPYSDIASLGRYSELAVVCFDLNIYKDKVTAFFNNLFKVYSAISPDNLDDMEWEYLYMGCENAARYFLDLKINRKDKAKVLLQKFYEQGTNFSIEKNYLNVILMLVRPFLNNMNEIGLSNIITKELYKNYKESYTFYAIHARLIESSISNLGKVTPK